VLFNLRVFLWGIVAELEYALYPWKDENPPEELAKKYNLTDTTIEQHLQYDWIQSHDQKIVRLQEEMLWVQKEIHKLNIELKTHD
jgi:stress response protein YsnF